MIKTALIDDELLARQNLTGILNRFFPEIELVNEADSVKSGIEMLMTEQVDLVFLDINLADGSGFKILEHFKHRDFHVIFLTAYDDFAIEAFGVEAVDYLLKPINLTQLKNSLEKVKKRKQQDEKRKTSEAKPYKLAINENESIHFIDVKDILRCKSDDNYTEIYLQDGTRILSARTLKEYSGILERFGFVRVHQSHLINLSQIVQVKKDDGWFAVMKNGDKISVSRRKKEHLFQELAQVQIVPEDLN